MMRRKAATAIGLAVATLGLTGAVTLNGWSGQVNTLRFGRSVAVPGAVLAAGEYSFEVVKAPDIVRVSSIDGRHTYFTGFTQRADRPRNLSPEHAIVLGEASADAPPPVSIWYPVEGGDGHRFIYRR